MMTWKDITIEKYYKIMDLLSVKDEYTALNLIDCIYGVDANELKLNELPNYSIDFLNKPIEDCEIPHNLVLNGHKYDVDFRLTEVTAAQFVDFQNYMRAEKQRYEDILSVFIFPEGKKYGGEYDIEVVKNDLLSLSIVDATAISRFFFLQFRLFVEIFRVYSTKAMEKMNLTEKEKETVLKAMEKINLQPLEYFPTF